MIPVRKQYNKGVKWIGYSLREYPTTYAGRYASNGNDR
jgi:hypothetical protein